MRKTRALRFLVVLALAITALQQTVSSASSPPPVDTMSTFQQWLAQPAMREAFEAASREAARSIDPQDVVEALSIPANVALREILSATDDLSSLSVLGADGLRIQRFAATPEFLAARRSVDAALAEPIEGLSVALRAQIATLYLLQQNRGFWSKLGNAIVVVSAAILAVSAVVACTAPTPAMIACAVAIGSTFLLGAGVLATEMVNNDAHDYTIMQHDCPDYDDCWFKAIANAPSTIHSWGGRFCFKYLPNTPNPYCRGALYRYTTQLAPRVYETYGITDDDYYGNTMCMPFVDIYSWFKWADGYTSYDEVPNRPKPISTQWC